jgi:2-polyprenyl-3-methyl-5-hydroxy-6-metoxy-1,4-benzoquinol methylase
MRAVCFSERRRQTSFGRSNSFLGLGGCWLGGDSMNYYQTHQSHLYKTEDERKSWLWNFFNDNYWPYFKRLNKTASILELGCSTGHLMNWLHYHGFTNLMGVDSSEEALEIAKLDGLSTICVKEDARNFLMANGGFGVIITRCMVPHLPKNEIIDFIGLMKKALVPGGRLIMEVGNMAAVCAPQERYVDFTHEAGFTKESLAQVLRQHFDVVGVCPSKDEGWRNLKRRCARWVAGNVLEAAHHSIDKSLIWSRDLIGVATK